ncbi:hypothetical protein [Ensifer sesbaniae]|uniref:hypothetical protein n=1 Tax=Ensifer sesbaniae TaxID=1214071 RepID=UPI00156A13F3|nr:hypothetical protein [Ensifer sesbaniae]
MATLASLSSVKTSLNGLWRVLLSLSAAFAFFRLGRTRSRLDLRPTVAKLLIRTEGNPPRPQTIVPVRPWDRSQQGDKLLGIRGAHEQVVIGCEIRTFYRLEFEGIPASLITEWIVVSALLVEPAGNPLTGGLSWHKPFPSIGIPARAAETLPKAIYGRAFIVEPYPGSRLRLVIVL